MQISWPQSANAGRYQPTKERCEERRNLSSFLLAAHERHESICIHRFTITVRRPFLRTTFTAFAFSQRPVLPLRSEEFFRLGVTVVDPVLNPPGES